MKVLFTDYDGVLNSREWDAKQAITGGDLCAPDPTLVIRLLGVIQDTGCQIVLSSSWRMTWTADDIAALPFPVLDVTPRGDAFGKRGDEIEAWLNGKAGQMIGQMIGQCDDATGYRIDVESFVILDDEPDAGYLHPDRFVRTNPQTGLTAADAAKIVGLFT